MEGRLGVFPSLCFISMGISMDVDDNAVVWENPAFLTNRIFLVVKDNVVRITFTEQSGPDALPVFRTAVAMSMLDAIALSDLLQRYLKKPCLEK